MSVLGIEVEAPVYFAEDPAMPRDVLGQTGGSVACDSPKEREVARDRHRDATIIMMRTTVNLPDDIYEVARSLATTKHTSMGEALAELVRRGLNPAPHLDTTAAFPRFRMPEDASPITLERTLAAEDEP